MTHKKNVCTSKKSSSTLFFLKTFYIVYLTVAIYEPILENARQSLCKYIDMVNISYVRPDDDT